MTTKKDLLWSSAGSTMNLWNVLLVVNQNLQSRFKAFKSTRLSTFITTIRIILVENILRSLKLVPDKMMKARTLSSTWSTSWIDSSISTMSSHAMAVPYQAWKLAQREVANQTTLKTKVLSSGLKICKKLTNKWLCLTMIRISTNNQIITTEVFKSIIPTKIIKSKAMLHPLASQFVSTRFQKTTSSLLSLKITHRLIRLMNIIQMGKMTTLTRIMRSKRIWIALNTPTSIKVWISRGRALLSKLCRQSSKDTVCWQMSCNCTS